MGVRIERMCPGKTAKRNTLGFITAGLWGLLSLISLNHLYSFSDLLVVSTTILGVLGWLVITLTVFFLAKSNLKQCFLIFATFVCLGYYLGPYLEPPADPFEHLLRTYDVCEKKSNQIERTNKGLWHYSMSGLILCSSEYRNATVMLRKIDLLHGLYWGLGLVVLFLLGQNAGLPGRWAFLSALLCFLFFGTNRFSYFSYYSLAASFSSMVIFWIWVTVFFFRKRGKDLLTGLLAALLGLPILWVNHKQEAAFLGAIAVIWLVWNLHERLWRSFSAKALKSLYLAFIAVILFVLPQIEAFRQILLPWFERNEWEKNQDLIYHWQEIHLIGKFWAYRVNDTLGFMGFLPLILAGLLLLPGFKSRHKEHRGRIILLGILPFLGYLLPLVHFIWVSNNIPEVYYRISYFSMFWLPLCYLLYRLEGCGPVLQAQFGRIYFLKGLGQLNNAIIKKSFFPVCLLVLILVSSIRSGPIYGKLDFTLLDSRPWWPEWEPEITKLIQKEKKVSIDTDPVTGTVLRGVFNQPANRFRQLSRQSIMAVESMGTIKNKIECLINLHGFEPSWVPIETGHWQPDIGNTSLYYRYKGISGQPLKNMLRTNPANNCQVFY